MPARLNQIVFIEQALEIISLDRRIGKKNIKNDAVLSLAMIAAVEQNVFDFNRGVMMHRKPVLRINFLLISNLKNIKIDINDTQLLRK